VAGGGEFINELSGEEKKMNSWGGEKFIQLQGKSIKYMLNIENKIKK
jgi:hypothetical protein